MVVKNTLKKGRVRWIIFRENNDWYGVALEFNFVISGASFTSVRSRLDKAIVGYVESIQHAKLRDNKLLNQKGEKEYEDLWKKIEANKPIPSPIQVASHGSNAVFV